MNPLNTADLEKFINTRIAKFHADKIKSLQQKTLKDLVKKKNPYLLKAKNVNTAREFVSSALEAFLSSSEEKLFGDLLEDLAIFISEKTCNGRKSIAKGIDLEFTQNKTLYIVSIKSGTQWGNNSQQTDQENDFKRAIRVYQQSGIKATIAPVLGICYGKTKSNFVRGAHKLVGQNFWYFISGNENLYADIIEPLGFRVKEHNNTFDQMKDEVISNFTKEFEKEYCLEDASIDWAKIIQFNSGNFDMDKYNI